MVSINNTYAANANTHLSVIANFSVDDNGTESTTDDSLIISLRNVGDAAQVPSDVLTGVYFDVSNTPTLSPVSAKLGDSSRVLNRVLPVADGDVGGEWAFEGGAAGLRTPTKGPAFSQHYAISASGLGVVGSGSAYFGKTNLQGPNNVGGMEYGIVNAKHAKANQPLQDNELIQDEVVFILTGYAGGTISNVAFQFGTSGDAFPCNRRFP